MASAEADMLDIGPIHQEIINGIFWLVWINFILGFANLVPLVPFDGGHRCEMQLEVVSKGYQIGFQPCASTTGGNFATKTANLAHSSSWDSSSCRSSSDWLSEAVYSGALCKIRATSCSPMRTARIKITTACARSIQASDVTSDAFEAQQV